MSSKMTFLLLLGCDYYSLSCRLPDGLFNVPFFSCHRNFFVSNLFPRLTEQALRKTSLVPALAVEDKRGFNGIKKHTDSTKRTKCTL